MTSTTLCTPTGPASSLDAGRLWVSGPTPEALGHIHNPAIHLSLWHRARPATLDWIDSLDWDTIDDVQETLPLDDFPIAIPAALTAAGYPSHEGTNALATEITDLARLFSQIMDSKRLRLRLEVIETDACRKFHTDNVKARLLMPLTEPGTQWIETDGGPINHLKAGDVGLFKGRMWTDAPAILHRSPPIAGSNVSRLLLVLDAQDAGPISATF